MAYVTTNPPRLLCGSLDGLAPQIWTYRSTDAAATVDANGYISNGVLLGMKVGDVVFVTDTDAVPPITTLHQVSAGTSPAVDLNDLTTITQTDSD